MQPAFLPVLIGNNIVLTARIAVVSRGALVLDLAMGNLFQVLVNQNIASFDVQNIAPDDWQLNAFQVAFVGNGSAYSVVFPANTVWAGGAAPTLSTGAGEVDILQFQSWDRGATWYGFVLGQAFA